MSGLSIPYTPALKRFRKKVGYANHRLNTIVVGLEGVKQGVVVKPLDLAVSWGPKDLNSASELARGFANNAVMIYMVDALDSYMSDLGNGQIWITDSTIASILRGDFQIDQSETRLYSEADFDTLLEQAKAAKPEPSALEGLLRRFTATHFGRRKRPSLVARFDALAALSGAVPDHYSAAMRFLISWRNRHAHGRSTERFSATVESSLRQSSSQFYEDHAHLDVDRMIKNYDDGNGPTLKEVSSLISVLQRVVHSVDQSVLSHINPEETFKAALKSAFSADPTPGKRLKEYWGRGLDARKKKLIGMSSPFGFQKSSNESDPLIASITEDYVQSLAAMTREDFGAIIAVQV